MSGHQNRSYAPAAITATAAGGQANAAQMVADMNIVGTVATIGDSVKLPPAAPGRLVIVKNTAANACDCFPQSGETINALAANAAYSIATVTSKIFFCVSPGAWHTIVT